MVHTLNKHPEHFRNIAKSEDVKCSQPCAASGPNQVGQKRAEERYAFDEVADEAAMQAEEVSSRAGSGADPPPDRQMLVTSTLRSFSDITNISPMPRPEPGRNHKMWVSFGQIRVKVCQDTERRVLPFRSRSPCESLDTMRI